MRRWFDRPLAIAGLASGWWILIALVSAANARGRGAAEDGWAAVGVALVAVAGWIPLTVGVHALVRRFPLRGPRWPRALAVLIAGAAAVVAIRASYIYALDPWVHFYDVVPRFGLVLMHSVENNLFVYWLFVGVGHAAIYARDAVERSRAAAALAVALSRAELAALTATLQPHFLFNTLGAVAELVHRDPAAADRAIVQLSAMLRRLIDDRRQVVPLGDELAFVRDYLAIEQLRFGDRLTVAWDVAPALLDAPVPRLCVQPLVENALRHGLWPSGRPGRLTIAARAADGALVITVVDDGVGPAAARDHDGAAGRDRDGATDRDGAGRRDDTDGAHGLDLVRARLAHLYAARGRLAFGAAPGGGARAEIVVPRA